MQCANCRFYIPHSKQSPDSGGECRRHAPGPISIDRGDSGNTTTMGAEHIITAEWPHVETYDFCGEFEEKQTKRSTGS